MLALTLALYAPIVLRRRGSTALRAAGSLPTLLAGCFMFGAYVLVLAALRLAPAAPVAALRESSVVFATVFAYLVLGEPMARARLLGAAVVVAGVAALALSP